MFLQETGAPFRACVCEIDTPGSEAFVSNFSYPYSKVQYFGVETAGVLDIDSEFILAFINGAKLQFDFKSQVNIKEICATISQFVL